MCIFREDNGKGLRATFKTQEELMENRVPQAKAVLMLLFDFVHSEFVAHLTGYNLLVASRNRVPHSLKFTFKFIH